jgi:hypothetical protein
MHKDVRCLYMYIRDYALQHLCDGYRSVGVTRGVGKAADSQAGEAELGVYCATRMRQEYLYRTCTEMEHRAGQVHFQETGAKPLDKRGFVLAH